jgi:hypothetical protein
MLCWSTNKQKDPIMATNRLTYTRNSLIAAALGAGIALGTIGYLHDPYAPSEPPLSAVSADVGNLQEDDPGWDCNIHGNRICGDPQGIHATDAWAAWDAGEGWRRLRAASTEVRVEYVGTATQSPNVDSLTEVAVPSRDGWYVFRAAPRHAATGPRQILPL